MQCSNIINIICCIYVTLRYPRLVNDRSISIRDMTLLLAGIHFGKNEPELDWDIFMVLILYQFQ